MGPAELSVFVFGIYLIVIGVAFLLVPNVPLRLLKFETTTEPWARALGLVVIVLGYYYLVAGDSGLEPLIRATVYGRFGVLVGTIGLAAFKKAKPQIVGFGAIDAAGAVWTLLAGGL